MAAEYRRPARRDGAHDAALDVPEMTGVLLPKRFAVAKISATSRAGAMTPAQPGGTTSRRSRSSGLGVLLMVFVATRV